MSLRNRQASSATKKRNRNQVNPKIENSFFAGYFPFFFHQPDRRGSATGRRDCRGMSGIEGRKLLFEDINLTYAGTSIGIINVYARSIAGTPIPDHVQPSPNPPIIIFRNDTVDSWVAVLQYPIHRDGCAYWRVRYAGRQQSSSITRLIVWGPGISLS